MHRKTNFLNFSAFGIWRLINFPKDLSVRLFPFYSTHIFSSNGTKFASVAINSGSNFNSARLFVFLCETNDWLLFETQQWRTEIG